MQKRDFRKDFPIFQKNPELVYLDSAATALKPRRVIEAVTKYYTECSANVARGLYSLSERATRDYERVRDVTAKFLHAPSREEIVFTRGTTESLNLLAYTLTENLSPEDEVAVTAMEHHANFVPWLELSQKRNFKFNVIPFDENGTVQEEALAKYITPKTKVFAFTHASNVFGSIHPAHALVRKAKELSPNIITVIDAAQSTPHIPVDVQAIGCDFLAFSAHKVFGPTGAGVLWGRKTLLNSLPPFLYGGEMIENVTKKSAVFKTAPHRFEAGTPPIAEIIGMGAALEYIMDVGFDASHAYESELAQYAHKQLAQTFGDSIHILGSTNTKDRVPLFSLTLNGIHPHDIAQILAEENICIRAGSHCAMPLHHALNAPNGPLNFPATARISL